MHEVTGSTAFGVAGVLLALLDGPLITVMFPLGATLKGNTIIVGAGAAPVLTI